MSNISKNTLKIKKDDFIVFLKKSKLKNKVFINNENVSNSMEISGDFLSFEKYKTKSKKIEVEIYNFDKKKIITLNEDKKYVFKKEEVIEENHGYFHGCEVILKVINNDKELFFKIIGINEKKLKFEVLGDNENFIYNLLGEKINGLILNNNENEIEIEINLKVSEKKDKVVIESDILKIEKNEFKKILDKIKEDSEKNNFIKELNKFEIETIGF